MHPAKASTSERAKLLYHALKRMVPEDGCELLQEALSLAERYGHRDSTLDGFAVLRQALCDAAWVLELGGDLEERLRRADAILRAAVCAVDEEEDRGTCFTISVTEEAA